MEPVLSESHVHLGGCTPLRLFREWCPRADFDRLQALQRQHRSGSTLDAFLGEWFEHVERLQSHLGFLEEASQAALEDFAAGSPKPGRFELRFCPFVRAADPEAQIRAVTRGLESASQRRAVPWTLTLIAMRGNHRHLGMLRSLLHLCDGVDAAGPENGSELDASWRADVVRTWRMARAEGKFTTYHSGEGSLEYTLSLLDSGAPLDRIGHGISLRHRDLSHYGKLPVFELCPAVNEATGVARRSEVADFANRVRESGNRFVLGSDNPALTGISFWEQASALPEWMLFHAERSVQLLDRGFSLSRLPPT